MITTRKICPGIGIYNAPSSFALSLLTCVVTIDESFDSKIPVLDPLDRVQLLYRLLSSNAARH